MDRARIIDPRRGLILRRPGASGIGRDLCSRAAVLLAVLVLAAGCRSGGEAPSEATGDAPEDRLAAAEYVGDDACASCHADLVTSFHRTGMGRSVSRFDAASAPERFDGGTVVYEPGSDYYYEPFVRNDTLFQREFRKDARGRVTYERVHAAEWVIGSGNHTRSYLMNVNGHVTEMPLTWYVDRGAWDMSPSYRQTNRRFSRPVVEECMTCHNGLPEHSRFTTDHYTDVPLGITCERCHGPASVHVDERLAGFEPGAGVPDPTIVNPAGLDRELQLAVCQQCHLTGVLVFKPGESMQTFRPGRPLATNRTVFAPEEHVDDPERFGIASHAQRLALSECHMESAMTCTTCHDPHTPVAELGEDHFNQVCGSCHQPAADEPVCSRDSAHDVAEAMQGDCVSCHMQQAGTSDIPHVTFTDHWIRRRLPEPVPPETIQRVLVKDRPLELVRILEEPTVDGTDASEGLARLEEAVAYFAFYDVTHRHPDYLPEVVEKAEQGLEQGEDLPQARIALGRALLEQGATARAVDALGAAAERYPEHARIAYWLGVAQIRDGNPGRAVEPLQRAVTIQPAFTEAYVKLGEALQNTRRFAEAEEAYRAALDRDPVHHPSAWNNLGYLYLQMQRTEEARSAFDEALSLDPDLAIALVNAGTVRLMEGDAAAAVPFFERALEEEPDNVPALGNLAMTYGRLGQVDRAVELAERLVAVQPRNAQARQLLDELRALQ